MKKMLLILLIIGLITILFVSCIPSVPPTPSEGEGEEEEVEPIASRVVLVELFNTQGCPACAQMNPIVEEVAQEYDKSQVILIEEAGWGLYSTPETSERYRWYLPESKERTTPNILFNGLNQRMHPGASAGGGEGPTNHRPTINSTPLTTATVGIAYSYQVMATDADGDSLTYSLNTAPEGMVIEVNTGLITWTPTEEQVGEQEVEVEVSDGKKSTTQSFTITVDETLLTSIVVLPPSMTLEIGESKAIASVTAHYDNGTEANIALTACTYESDKPSTATASSSGTIKGIASCTASTAAIITVSYTEDSITKTDTVSVVVTNPSPG